MNYEDLTPEQMQKAKALQTSEELFAFAKEEGFELSNEELDAIAGGKWSDNCPDFECYQNKCITLNCGRNTCDEQFCPLR